MKKDTQKLVEEIRNNNAQKAKELLKTILKNKVLNKIRDIEIKD